MAHAQKLYQGLRAQYLDLKIVIGLWNYAGEPKQAAIRISGIADGQFDFNEAVHQAIGYLSKNPKGFFLVAHSNCATGKSRTSLQRIVDLDKGVSVTGEELKSTTLIIYTADHGYDLRIKGETLTETLKASDHTKILSSVSLDDEHAAEEVPLLAVGPGSEKVNGFTSYTAVFHIIMQNFGWEKTN